MFDSKSFLIAMAALSAASAAYGVDVKQIDPPHWWTGMKDSSLQLQVHGKDIRDAQFSVDYPGVSIDSVARLNGSPNWQYIYLNISPDTKPGEMTLEWKEGKKKIKRKYELQIGRASCRERV